MPDAFQENPISLLHFLSISFSRYFPSLLVRSLFASLPILASSSTFLALSIIHLQSLSLFLFLSLSRASSSRFPRCFIHYLITFSLPLSPAPTSFESFSELWSLLRAFPRLKFLSRFRVLLDRLFAIIIGEVHPARLFSCRTSVCFL